MACLTMLLIARPLPVHAGRALEPESWVKEEQKARQQEFNTEKKRVASLPSLPAKSVDEVFGLSIHDRHLICATPLLDESQIARAEYRLAVPAFSGPTSVHLSGSGGKGEKRKGAAKASLSEPTMRLITYELPSDQLMVTTTLHVHAGQLDIVRTTQVNSGGRTIRLIDQRGTDGRGGSARLMVDEDSLDNDEIPPIDFHATDFYTLMREHPAEIERYVRPLLHDLGQEVVFAPDPMVAWQVFPEKCRQDPEVAQMVSDLLPALGSSDFHVRDRAMSDLQKMGRPAAAVLIQTDRAPLSPQQNLLIDRALAQSGQFVPAEMARLRVDKGFLLDCLYSNDRTIRSAAFEQLQKICSMDLKFDLDADLQVRTGAITELRRQLIAVKP